MGKEKEIYLTSEGFLKLEEELNEAKTVKRPQIIKDLKEEFSQKLENNKALNIKEYYLELIKIFLNHVEDKKDIYSSIMIHNRNSIMMDILLSAINDDILKRISKEKFSDGIPAEIIAKFYVGGVLNLGFEYLNSNGKYSKEDIISYIDKLIKDEK